MSNISISDLWEQAAAATTTTTIGPKLNTDLASEQNVTSVLDWLVIYGSMGIYLGLLAVGLFFITLFIVVLIHGRELFGEFPLFFIIANLIGANELNIVVQWTTVVPMMLFDFDPNLEDTVNQIGGILNSFSEEAATYFTFLIAANRLIIFLYPNWTHWFSGHRLKLLCLANWIWIAGIVALKNTFGITSRFGKNSKTFYNWSSGGPGDLFNIIFTAIGLLIPFLILLIYGVIYSHIKRQRGKARFCKNDLRILKEAMIIAAFLELARVSQYFIPFFYRSLRAIPWLKWTSQIFLNVANIANNSINSILFLFHNRVVKRAIYGILKKDYVDTSNGDQIKHLQPSPGKKSVEKEKSRSSSAPATAPANIN